MPQTYYSNHSFAYRDNPRPEKKCAFQIIVKMDWMRVDERRLTLDAIKEHVNYLYSEWYHVDPLSFKIYVGQDDPEIRGVKVWVEFYAKSIIRSLYDEALEYWIENLQTA